MNKNKIIGVLIGIIISVIMIFPTATALANTHEIPVNSSSIFSDFKPSVAHADPNAYQGGSSTSSSKSSSSSMTDANKKIDQALQEALNKINSLLTILIALLQRFLWPILLLIGGLMRSDVIFGGGMEQRMLDIWVQIRNLVNVLFVLVIVGVALVNVLGVKLQGYELKAIMPKFIIALVAVNFSFIGMKVAIDVVNVVTTAVFALPSSVSMQSPVDSNPNYESDLCKLLYGEQGVPEKDTNGSYCLKNSSNELKLSDEAKQWFGKYNGQNFALVMAINYMKISQIDKVQLGNDVSIKNLTLNMLFSVIFYVIYGASFIILFIILLVRLVVIWITMILSPLIFLKMVLPQNVQKMMGGDKDIAQLFFKHAIAPVPIALFMTIGYIMLDAMNKATYTSNPEFNAKTLSLNFLASGTTTLQDIIVGFATAAIVWSGVVAAGKDTMAKGLVEKVQKTVEGAKKMAVGALETANIIPVDINGKHVNTSIGAITDSLTTLGNSTENEKSRQAEEFRKEMGFAVNKDYIDNAKGAKTGEDLIRNVKAVDRSALTPDDYRELGKKLAQLSANNNIQRDIKNASGINYDGRSISYNELLKYMKEGPDEKVRKAWDAFFTIPAVERLQRAGALGNKDAQKTDGKAPAATTTKGGAQTQPQPSSLQPEQQKKLDDARNGNGRYLVPAVESGTPTDKRFDRFEELLKATQDSSSIVDIQLVKGKTQEDIETKIKTAIANALTGVNNATAQEKIAIALQVKHNLLSDVETSGGVLEEAEKTKIRAAADKVVQDPPPTTSQPTQVPKAAAKPTPATPTKK